PARPIADRRLSCSTPTRRAAFLAIAQGRMIASARSSSPRTHPVELYFNPESPFTRWVVQQGLLRERFVVVDVGCQGGVHVQWDLLGDLGEVHAFDAIKEAVEDLARRETRPNRHYYNIALGNE